jgi:adenosylcobyric acid synthase
LSGVTVTGYEIHHGQTKPSSAIPAKSAYKHLLNSTPQDEKYQSTHEVVAGIAWQNAAGNVLGCYLHGLFEDSAVLHALFGISAPTLDTVFDGLAHFLAQHTAPGLLASLITRTEPQPQP